MIDCIVFGIVRVLKHFGILRSSQSATIDRRSIFLFRSIVLFHFAEDIKRGEAFIVGIMGKMWFVLSGDDVEVIVHPHLAVISSDNDASMSE